MSEVETKRGFKGVWIPKEIWLSPKLSLQEKVFLVEIESLDNEDGCFASNAHFAKFFGLSKGRVSQVITELEKKELITCKYIYGENKNITKRIVRVVRKLNTPIKETKEGYIGNDEGSNTSTSNTKSISDIYSIYEYWNEKKITVHRELNQTRKSKINPRLANYSVDEIKKAIDNYSYILNNEEYYYTHKFKLERFMDTGVLDNFLDENNPFENYKKTDKLSKSQTNKDNIEQIRRELGHSEQRRSVEDVTADTKRLL